MRITAITPWALALLLLAAGFGCPDGDDDDTGDDDDSAADDDDSAADDDDTGDDDSADDDDATPEDPPFVFIEGAETQCASLRSVIWLDQPAAPTDELFIFAATVDDYCARWQAFWAAIDANIDLMNAFNDAVEAEDGPAACAAMLAFETAVAAEADALYPLDECVAEIFLGQDVPGEYSATVPSGFSLEASAVFQSESLIDEFLAAFGGCAGVIDWESWQTLEEDLDMTDRGQGVRWNVLAGRVELLDSGGGSTRQVVGEDLNALNMESGDEAPMSLELEAQACAPL